MKTRLHLYLCLFALICQNAFAGVEWLTDVNAALLRAPSEHKIILLDFTGSDWCGWCKKLKAEVFDKPDFAAYANANLLMVEVDFPRHKQLSAEQQEANDKLARTYGIRGYPTVIVLDASGKLLGQTGYVDGGPKNFIASLEKIPGVGHHATEGSAQSVAQAEPAAPPRPQPQFVPIAPTNPTAYGDLALKGISGLKDRRMAMINNQTLTTGETGKVKVHDQRVDVTLKEIRDDSVLVVVGGETRELRMKQ